MTPPRAAKRREGHCGIAARASSPFAHDERSAPVRASLLLVRHKWAIRVLEALADERDDMRFSELLRTLHDVSSNMLSSTLRELVRGGLVVRRAERVVPQQVYYRISDLGSSLMRLLEGLRR